MNAAQGSRTGSRQEASRGLARGPWSWGQGLAVCCWEVVTDFLCRSVTCCDCGLCNREGFRRQSAGAVKKVWQMSGQKAEVKAAPQGPNEGPVQDWLSGGEAREGGPMWRSGHTPDVVTGRTTDVQGKERQAGRRGIRKERTDCVCAERSRAERVKKNFNH